MLRSIVALSLLLPALAGAQDVSGEGDGFVVAVDPSTHTITGYYSSGTGIDASGQGPQFSCIFFLRGSAQGKPPYRIVTWFPADPSQAIEGDLRFSHGAATHSVTLRLEEEPGGCGNVQQFAASEGGANLALDRTGDWSQVRVVAARRAHFHASATDAQPQRSFVTTGDPVKVSASQPGWVQATFTNPDNRSTSGWLKEGDLFPAERPVARAKR